MLPNNKLFVVWILDELGLCEDVIRWEVMMWLVDWERELIEGFGVNWREGGLYRCFNWGCRMGCLDIVKWLWWMSDGSIDINASAEDVFA